MRQIRKYSWPGNVRELENVLERAILFTNGREIMQLDSELSESAGSVDGWKDIRDGVVANAERAFLQEALRNHQGDVKKVAELMQLTSRAVYGKLKKHQIDVRQFRG